MSGSLGLSESVVIRSLRRLRDRYFPGNSAPCPDTRTDHEDPSPGCLESLPVEVQFLLLTYLSPPDLCVLGSTCQYWRGLVRDALLWRFFLIRDLPQWSSIDHLSMPRLHLLDRPITEEGERWELLDRPITDEHGRLDRPITDEQERRELLDRPITEEGERRDRPITDEQEGLDNREEAGSAEAIVDYMAEYLRCSPSCRQRWLPSVAPYSLTSFLQSLGVSSEPRYAMFGPGMEHLEVSFVTRLMHAPDVLPVSTSGTPHRQINGIGSGISYLFNSQQKLNILTLYSANRADRERARTRPHSVDNRLFLIEDSQSGVTMYRPAPHVLEVCQLVNGFIYVANAEHDEQGSEAAQIQAVMDQSWGSTSRPLLVLSCVSREGLKRVPCVFIAKRLELTKLPNPWMVQDVVVESLSGVLDGISWLLRCSGVKLHNR